MKVISSSEQGSKCCMIEADSAVYRISGFMFNSTANFTMRAFSSYYTVYSSLMET